MFSTTALADDYWDIQSRSIRVFTENKQQPDFALAIVQDTSSKKLILIGQFIVESKSCSEKGIVKETRNIAYINKQGVSMNSKCIELDNGLVIEYVPANDSGLNFLVNTFLSEPSNVKIQINASKPFIVPTKNFKEAYDSIADKVL